MECSPAAEAPRRPARRPPRSRRPLLHRRRNPRRGPHPRRGFRRASRPSWPRPRWSHAGLRTTGGRERQGLRRPQRGGRGRQGRGPHLRRRHDGRPGAARRCRRTLRQPRADRIAASAEGARSTVFMTGRWAEEYPDQAAVDRHRPPVRVANHSFSHYAFSSPCYGLPTVAQGGHAGRCGAGLHRVPQGRGRATSCRTSASPAAVTTPPRCSSLAPAGVTAVQWDVVSGDAFATDADAVAEQVLERGAAPVSGGRHALHPQRGPRHRGRRPPDRPGAARPRLPLRQGLRADARASSTRARRQPERRSAPRSCQAQTGQRVRALRRPRVLGRLAGTARTRRTAGPRPRVAGSGAGVLAVRIVHTPERTQVAQSGGPGRTECPATATADGEGPRQGQEPAPAPCR